MTFCVCTGPYDIGLTGQCHISSGHRDPSHTVDLAVHYMAITHTAVTVLAGTALAAHNLTFDCAKENPKILIQCHQEIQLKTHDTHYVPGHGLLPHFCISTGRPVHCTVVEFLTQVLLLTLRPPPQVTEHAPHRPHRLHSADHTTKTDFKFEVNNIVIKWDSFGLV